jgi:hypothetical protein
MLMCVFTHSCFIKNPSAGSWETNPCFSGGFCHNLRLELNQVSPNKFTIIIHKTYMILVLTNRLRFWPPYIKKHKFERIMRHASRLWIWELVTISLLTRITHIIFIRLMLTWKIKTLKSSLNNWMSGMA